jgi:hypothetical protein
MDPTRPNGPIRAAATWLHHVKVNHDLESAWPSTHADYRQFLVDTWLWGFRNSPTLEGVDLKALRECLLADGQPAPCLPRAAIWDQFALTTLAALDELWDTIVWEHSGWGTEPRVVAPDHELVVIFDKATEEPVELRGPTPLRGIGFELKGSDGDWRVSNVAANELESPAP